MKELLDELLILKKQYPDRVDLYPPATEQEIRNVEAILKIDLNESLRSFYKFSNGLGIVDYCIPSINIKHRANLAMMNSDEEYLGDSESRLIDFLGTSRYEDYCYLIDEKGDNPVYRRLESDEWIKLTDSFSGFFEKFLKKCQTLLQIMDPDDFVAFFDDDDFPESLDTWD